MRRKILPVLLLAMLSAAAILIAWQLVPATAQPAALAITVNVDTSQDRAAISPYVYGANDDMGLDLVTFRRLGGNRMTGYNWENNASNAGIDWQHQSDNYMCGIQSLSAAQCNTAGGVITHWHDRSVAIGAASELTLEMAGYVAADMNGPVAQSETAPSLRWDAAVLTKGAPFTTAPSLTDGKVYIDEQVNFMVSRYGGAAGSTGVKFYGTDNEPDIWASTHPRIHPTPVSAVELVNRTAELASAVKAVDPAAMIFGYESYGFNGYYSLQDAPDWASVKGSYGWYIDYYLDQMRLRGATAGKRLLDVLSVHWYPEAQGGGQRIVFGGTGSLDTQKARVQAPRSLWDATYHETSWIAQYYGSYLPLIPRLQQSINTYYPGTGLAFTEFAYGGEADISGGLATADALGIFGRYGVFAAAYWPVESDQSYVRAAYRLYRDYDGAGGKYGDTRVRATISDAANASTYAAITGSDDTTLHLIILNKSFDSAADFTFNLAGGRAYTSGEVWAFDASNAAITQRTAIGAITANTFAYTLPARSAAHIILHGATGPTATPTATITPGGPTLTATPTRTATPTPTPTSTPVPANDLIVYGDALASGWQDWSWDATVNFANTSSVQSGTRSIALKYNAGWSGLSLHAPGPVNTASYTGVSFWAYGVAGSGAVSFYIQQTDAGSGSPAITFTPAVGQWTQIKVTWSQLGSPGQVTRLNWQENTGSSKPTFYIDDVRLLAPCAAPPVPSGVTARRSVDDVVLSWSAAPGATYYQVWRATGPYFAPPAATPIATVTSPSHTDPGLIGDPLVNYFYALTAVNRCSQGSATSATSAEVGEFDFKMIPGQ
jgi:hypothetical protein